MESGSPLQLADFDWNLKYVIGSSSLSTLEKPLVNVIFHLSSDKNTANSVKNPPIFKSLSLEMDKQELKLFIDKLEKANQNS